MSRGTMRVSIGAFCLMSNHFHLLLQEIEEGGISAFVQKLGTAYTMYFNIKYQRVGGLFCKPFRSIHVDKDEYLQQVIQYIHCNPAEIYEPLWKEGHVRDIQKLKEQLIEYKYGSLAAFPNGNHYLRPILNEDVFDVETQQTINQTLDDALVYYREHVEASP